MSDAQRKLVITAEGVAKAPYNYYADAVLASGGRLLFVSGQGALDVEWNLIGKGDMKAQARQCLKNIKTIIEAAGGTMADIVSTIVYVTDISYYKEIAEVRQEFCIDENGAHTSTLIEVTKINAPDAMIEIVATAVI